MLYGWRWANSTSALKKTTYYDQRKHDLRIAYLQELRRLIPQYGSQNIVYIDESGFTAHSYRPHAWALRGQKVFGSISATNRKTTNLIMAQRHKRWLAPLLFKDSCNTQKVLHWLKEHLLPLLTEPSIMVIDNAPFHNKEKIRELLKGTPHILLPLPPYSPDFNPIEHSFSFIKKRRQFHPSHDLDAILMSNN